MKILTTIDLLALPGLGDIPAGHVGFGAKSDGLYQKIGTVETRLSVEGHTHTKSQITDFPTSMPASDVYAWAKAATKPAYTYTEVGAAAASHTHAYLPLTGGTLTGGIANGSSVSHIASVITNGTGIIDIKLPDINWMGSLYIDLYTYGNTSFGTLLCQVYTYYPSSTNFAGANSVYWVGGSPNFETVRYVTIGTDNYAERHILIGGVTTNWSFGRVSISRALQAVGSWASNPPTISLITTEPTVLSTSHTFTNFATYKSLYTDRLFTGRTINGVSFDGSANITITAATPAILTRGSYLTGNNFNGSTATTWGVDATSANTASKVVARDASGNFSAGTITASLSGNATTATTATNLSRSVLAGNGLTGGGALSADVTLTMGTPSTLTAASTNAVTATSHTHAITTTSVGAVNTIVQTNANGAIGTSRFGTYGVYSAAQTQGVWGIGSAYMVNATTTGLGTLYGLGYSYISVGGSSFTNEHQIHFASNGTAFVSISLSTGKVKANTFIGALTGNADTATSLSSVRTFAATGDATGSVSSNLSAGFSMALTLANSGVTAGTYRSVTVDAKGRVTAGTNPTTLSGYGITDAAPISHSNISGESTIHHTHTNKAIINQITQSNLDVLAKLSIVNGALQISTDAYSTGELTAYGAGTSTTVLTGISTTGAGNAITSIEKIGSELLATKGITFALESRFQVVTVLPASPDPNTYYFIKE